MLISSQVARKSYGNAAEDDGTDEDLLLLLKQRVAVIIDLVFQLIPTRLLNSCFVKNIYKLGEQRLTFVLLLQMSFEWYLITTRRLQMF